MSIKDSFYILSYSWYEDYVPMFLIGPDDITESEFQDMTKNLIDDAVKSLLDKVENKNEYISYIGWQEISQEVALLLENKGFIIFKPKESNFWGSLIIDSKDVENKTRTPDESNILKINPETLKRLIEYNEKLLNS